MTACTENRECLVLDNTATSNQISDCVFWYRANVHDKFRIGSNKFWKYGTRMLKSDDDEGAEGASSHVISVGDGGSKRRKTTGGVEIVKRG